MDPAENIVINLVSSLIWAIIGAVAYTLFRATLRRRATAFSRMSGICHASKKIHLVYGLVDLRRDGTHYSIDEGDVCALCLALSFMETKFGPHKIFAINSQAALTNLGSYTDIVAISGPVWNDISGHFINAVKSLARFAETVNASGETVDALEVQLASGAAVFTTAYEDGVPRECYAMVVAGAAKSGRADGVAQNVVVAAGISALGTYGAVCWLGTLIKSAPRKLSKQMRRRNRTKVTILRVVDTSPKGFRAYAADNSCPSFLTVEAVYEFVLS